MSDAARRLLARLVKEHGSCLAADSRRCKALLGDHLDGESRKEVNVLVAAVQAKVIGDLLAAGEAIPVPALLARLARKLHDETGIADHLALWGVESWALALGLIALEKTTPAPQEKTVKSDADEVHAEAGARRDDLGALRREGETKLAEFLLEVLGRTQGKPTPDDTAAFNQLLRRYQVPSERGREIVGEIRQRWLGKEQQRQRAEEDYWRQQRLKEAREHAGQGLAMLKASRHAEAVAAADYALKLDPCCGLAYAVRALTNLSLGNQDQAFRDAAEAVRIDPANSYAYVSRGMVHVSREKLDRALPDFEEAIRLDPRNPLGHAGRGLTHHFMGNQDQAIADLTTALKVDDTDSDVYLGRAEAYLWKGEYDRAIRDSTAALRLNAGDAAAYYTRAEAHRMKSHYDRAIADASQVIRLAPDHAGAYFTRADCRRMKGELDLAVEDATAAIRLSPDHAEAYGTRAAAQFHKGDYGLAIEDAREALRITPDNELARSVLESAKQGQANAEPIDVLPAEDDFSLSEDEFSLESCSSGDLEVEEHDTGELLVSEEVEEQDFSEDSVEFELAESPPCPRCGREVDVPSDHRGQAVRCRGCGKVFTP